MAYDPSAFEARRRAATQNYAATGAANAYARLLGQQRGARSRTQMQEQYQQAQPQLVRSLSRRNLYGPNVRSGLFNRAMQDFARQQTRQMAEFEQEQTAQQRQYDLEEARLLEQYRQYLADLEAEKAREIASAAQQLYAFRVGGA